jgi:hypothetical protein
MTLEQLSYVAQIGGVILLIGSLLYVGRQLRQNTEMMQANNASNFVSHTNELVSPITTNRDFAEFWIKAETEFDAFDDIDKRRIILFEWKALQAWHNWFNLHQRKLISEYHWAELNWGFRHFGQRPSTREAWKLFRGSYTKEFRDYMAKYLE